jgi:hypothetical protein
MKLIKKLYEKTINAISNINEEGQSTAEYALVILGAAALAGILIAWASSGSITSVFNKVLQRVLDGI